MMIRSGIALMSVCRPQACASGMNVVQKRTSFYNRWPHGPTKRSNPDPDYYQWFKDFFKGEGWEWFKGEVNRISRLPFRTIITKERPHNEVVIFEHFDSDEALKEWKPVADSDTLNGFSHSKIVRSPAGHALFTGVLDNRVPDDGVTDKSGFAGIIGPLAPHKLTDSETHWDWSEFNSLEIRFRGDGRRYSLQVSTASYNDETTYYDTYTYPLFTRGGPYWQTTRINFIKFFHCNKGFIQDDQGLMPAFHVKFLAITLQDHRDGPFELEIDYIGLAKNYMVFLGDYPYEGYSFPHFRYRQISVDCAPPNEEEE